MNVLILDLCFDHRDIHLLVLIFKGSFKDFLICMHLSISQLYSKVKRAIIPIVSTFIFNIAASTVSTYHFPHLIQNHSTNLGGCLESFNQPVQVSRTTQLICIMTQSHLLIIIFVERRCVTNRADFGPYSSIRTYSKPNIRGSVSPTPFGILVKSAHVLSTKPVTYNLSILSPIKFVRHEHLQHLIFSFQQDGYFFEVNNYNL